MPYRTIPLVNNEYYHIFNRGVAKMRTFNNTLDYKRFLRTMHYYQIDGQKHKLSNASKEELILESDDKLLDIITYCLMSNHFHFVLKQRKENGISNFIRKISNSYTKYINTKYNRVGPLFQGPFKSVHIESNEQLLHVSRYIHLNPIASYTISKIQDYSWSSYKEYIHNSRGLCEKNIILNQFSQKATYKQFVLDQIDYAQKLESIKHLLIDYET